MGSQSKQLEQEADQTRAQLSATLGELRAQITPGQVIDRVVDYASEGPAAEFLSNLRREIRENPLPLVLIGIGIAWLMVASSRSARGMIASTADSAAKKAADISAATSAVVSRTREWGQQTAERVVDRMSDVTSQVADRTRDVTGAAADKVRTATSTTADATSARSTGGPEPASVCEGARDEVDRRGLTTKSVAVSNATAQLDTNWEDTRPVEPAHERR
jgi:ElaB/YqjD/DUF883 family membrane-anchored ribosome-binding protein